VHVRDFVPEVSHVLAKPPHAPKSVQVVAPQLAPSVTRMQGSISVTGWSTHFPSLQTWSTQLRVMMPVSAQASAYEHMPKGSHDRGAQPHSPDSEVERALAASVDRASALAPPSAEKAPVAPSISPKGPPSGHRLSRDGVLWKRSWEVPSLPLAAHPAAKATSARSEAHQAFIRIVILRASTKQVPFQAPEGCWA
jgi:hypothetical protein